MAALSDDPEILIEDDILAAASRLAAGPERKLLGLTGAPAAGKSSLAAALAKAIGERAIHVPMDGFHLSQGQLDRLGRSQRKGAPDTFDALGFRDLLRRIASAEARGQTLFAPDFDRSVEEPIAASLAIDPAATLIITEGNYLLLDESPWREAASMLDAIWFIDVEADRRERWLADRHRRFGADASAAQAWIDRVDRPNALMVAETAKRADRHLCWKDATVCFAD